jgi:hypothetical protein
LLAVCPSLEQAAANFIKRVPSRVMDSPSRRFVALVVTGQQQEASASCRNSSSTHLANGGLDFLTNKAAINRGISLENKRASGLEAHDELPLGDKVRRAQRRRA